MTKEQDEFPFDRARRVLEEETAEFRKAISDQFDVKLRDRGRQALDKSEKYVPISIRLEPAVIEWAKKQADLKGVGYQIVINDILRGVSRRRVQRGVRTQSGVHRIKRVVKFPGMS